MFKLREYPGGRWEADINLRRPSGERIRERVVVPVTGKESAKRWAQEREAHLLLHGKQRAPGPGDAPREAPTLASFQPDFMEGYSLANNEKPSSRIAKESIFKVHLVPRFGSTRLDRITTEEVQKLKAQLAKDGRKPKTVNNVLTVLNTTLRIAVEWDRIPVMPCTIRLVKAPRPKFSFYEFGPYADLVEAAGKLSWQHQLVVLLGGDAGLRLGEMIGLEWTDLDLKRRTIHVQRAVYRGHVTTPKGSRDRLVDMTDALHGLLSAHRAVGVERVLVQAGMPVTRNILTPWLRAAQQRANLKATGALHVLRHTFCSHLAMKGATPKAIQELAGHVDLATTQRYMHLSPAHKAEAIALLNHRPEERGGLAEAGSK